MSIQKNKICEPLENLKKAGVHYLTKWFTLNDKKKLEATKQELNLSDRKLQAIKRSELYAGFSSQFNDVFDSQIRVSGKDKKEIVTRLKLKHCNCETNRKILRLPNFICECLEASLKTLEQQMIMFHSLHIACFSELDPFKLESNHMWGLYGGSGLGVALQYKIGDISQFLINNNSFGCIPVEYSNKNNKREVNNRSEWLYSMCHDILCSTKKDSGYLDLLKVAVKKQTDFLSYKSEEWQFEKEWRLVGGAESLMDGINAILAEQLYTYGYYENGLQMMQNKSDEYRNNHTCLFDFAQPVSIVFGWKVDDSDVMHKKYYKELYEWAKNNNIKCSYLTTTLDYNKNCFIKR